MDIKEAKKLFRKRIELEEYSGMTTNTLKEAMRAVLEELDKKDKIIDEMAPRVYLTREEKEDMKKDIRSSFEGIPFSRWVKKYFERKVEDKSC